MAREFSGLNEGGLSEAPSTADGFFALGMMQSSGRDAPIDLISAHKWFNIAAARGHQQAAQLRREIAAQLSDSEIGLAQRAARDWLKANPLAVAAAVVEIRAAA